MIQRRRRWWWCPERRVAFLVVFCLREFFRLGEFSFSLNSRPDSRSSSSLNIHKTISFLHLFFQSLRGESRKFKTVLGPSNESSFGCSLVAPHHKHICNVAQADRRPNYFPITYCHALSAAPTRLYSEKRDIHHICRVQIYVTTRAYNAATRVHTFLIWYFVSSLGSRRENIRSMIGKCFVCRWRWRRFRNAFGVVLRDFPVSLF